MPCHVSLYCEQTWLTDKTYLIAKGTESVEKGEGKIFASFVLSAVEI